MPNAKNLELSMAAAAGDPSAAARAVEARTPSPMQDEAEGLRTQLQSSMRRDFLTRVDAHRQVTDLANALAAAEQAVRLKDTQIAAAVEQAVRLKDTQIAEMELRNSRLQKQVIEIADELHFYETQEDDADEGSEQGRDESTEIMPITRMSKRDEPRGDDTMYESCLDQDQIRQRPSEAPDTAGMGVEWSGTVAGHDIASINTAPRPMQMSELGTSAQIFSTPLISMWA